MSLDAVARKKVDPTRVTQNEPPLPKVGKKGHRLVRIQNCDYCSPHKVAKYAWARVSSVNPDSPIGGVRRLAKRNEINLLLINVKFTAPFGAQIAKLSYPVCSATE